MTTTPEETFELKDKFWRALAHSPFVMLQLDNDPTTAAPMSAQLDDEVTGKIWFFTSRQGRFAELGPVTATLSAKGHDLFARFTGTLVVEDDRARFEKQWNNFVAAWFPGGKDDPDVLMLRMNLGDAAIWDSNLGLLTTAKMALGMDVTGDTQGTYVETQL